MSLTAVIDSPRRPLAYAIARATRRRAGLIYALLTLLLLSPALIWPIPRTGDIVNHWARLGLLGAAADDPLRVFYEVRWGAIPNLGVDLLYLALAPALSAQSVARLAWALSVALPALGAWWVHRALFKTPQLGILFAPLISYNLVATTGLVNIGMGLGFALLIVAWRLRLGDRVEWRHLVGLNLAALALIACHIIAFGFLAVTLGLIEVAPRAGEHLRRALLRGLASPRFVAAGLVALPFLERTPRGLAYAGAKWQALIAPVQSMSPYDLAFGELIVIVLGLAIWRRRLAIAIPMRWPLAGLALVVLAAPSTFGAGVLLDARLAVFATYLAFASLRWPWRGVAGAWVCAFAVGAAILRLAVLAPEWAAYDTMAAQTRATITSLPAGVRVLAIRPPSHQCTDPQLPFLAGLAPLVVIDRHDFVNALFALPGVQPVRPRDPALVDEPNMAWDASFLTQEGQKALGPLRDTAWAKALLDWRAHYDAVLLLHGRCDWRFDGPDIETLASGSGATVYRMRR